jgi:hypothetical protein
LSYNNNFLEGVSKNAVLLLPQPNICLLATVLQK